MVEMTAEAYRSATNCERLRIARNLVSDCNFLSDTARLQKRELIQEIDALKRMTNVELTNV